MEAWLPADCDLDALDCGCDMVAVLCSCGSEEGRDNSAVYSQSSATRRKHRPRDRGGVKQTVGTQ